jgi:hypothetical protein
LEMVTPGDDANEGEDAREHYIRPLCSAKLARASTRLCGIL